MAVDRSLVRFDGARMTRYLSGQPFSNPVSDGTMTDFQYDVAVGNLVPCVFCGDYVRPGEIDLCPVRKTKDELGDDV